MSSSTSPKRRRLLTFSLRALLIVVLLVAAALGAWRYWIYPYQVQRETAERFRKLGAEVEMQEGGPEWCRTLFGSKNIQDVTRLSLEEGTRAHLTVQFQGQSTGQYPLPNSTLPYRTATFADLSSVVSLPQLRHLELPGANIDNDCLEKLRRLDHLEFLDISRSKVTDEGLVHLSDLHSLKRLDLAGLPISDSGLHSLSGLECLESLDLSDTQITDAGLAYLYRWPSLKFVFLNGTPVTDGGLAHLRALQNLTVLELCRTDVSYSGLASLETKNLRLLGVGENLQIGTGIFGKLRKRMPNIVAYPSNGMFSRADVFVDQPDAPSSP